MTSQRSGFVLALLLLFVLESAAREPITRPPVTPGVEGKTVRARDLGIPFDGTPDTNSPSPARV